MSSVCKISHGDERWFLDGELHRDDDRPAIKHAY